MSEKITSMTNPRIRRLVELRKKARLRRESGLFVIEGTRLCMDTPPELIEEVYTTEEWIGSAAPADREKILDRRPVLVSREVMAKAADTESPQGILCTAKMPSWSFDDLTGTSDTGAPLILVLEDIQDPGNLGTIFRTAEAAGATGILMSRGTVDLFNPKTVRATMSAIFRIPFFISGSLCRDLASLRERGISSYAAHLGGTRPYDEMPLSAGTAFLIGNEGNGLSGDLTQAADEKIIIPMAGGAESLNAAMAAGILLFEAVRQRRKKEPE